MRFLFYSAIYTINRKEKQRNKNYYLKKIRNKINIKMPPETQLMRHFLMGEKRLNKGI